MNEIVRILMERDGLTKTEATSQMMEAREMMHDCEFDPLECENIMYDMLGLEMDYIFSLI